MLPPFKVCKVGVLPSMKLYTSWERFQLLKAGTRSSHWVRQRGLIELTPESAVLSPCRLETRRQGVVVFNAQEMQMQVQTPCFVPSWQLIPFPPVSPSHPSAPRCSHTQSLTLHGTPRARAPGRILRTQAREHTRTPALGRKQTAHARLTGTGPGTVLTESRTCTHRPRPRLGGR